MLRICLAASGEEVVALDAGKFKAVVEQYGSTVASLKRYLAQRHFLKRFARLHSMEMEEESTTLPLDLQLILMNHLPPDEERDASFIESCGDGRVHEVVENLKAPQNPNVVTDDATALMWAAANGREEVARLLLQAGADTEWRDDGTLFTALHSAATCGYSEVVRILLEFDWDMEAVDTLGRRPLHWASLTGHAGVAQVLLDSGADKEAEDRWGQRPLHLAAKNGIFKVVEKLVEAGAEKNALDKRGRTAAQLATQFGRHCVSQLLQDDKRRRLS